jgi:hypothetical protein
MPWVFMVAHSGGRYSTPDDFPVIWSIWYLAYCSLKSGDEENTATISSLLMPMV